MDHSREECALASLRAHQTLRIQVVRSPVFFSLGSFHSFYSSMSDHEDGALDPGAGVPDPQVLSPEVEEMIEQAA